MFTQDTANELRNKLGRINYHKLWNNTGNNRQPHNRQPVSASRFIDDFVVLVFFTPVPTKVPYAAAPQLVVIQLERVEVYTMLNSPKKQPR